MPRKPSRLFDVAQTIGKEVVEILKSERGPRLMSQIAHATLGANAAAGVGGSTLAGALNGLVLEGVANSGFGNSIAGGVAVAAGYGFMALGNAQWNLSLPGLNAGFLEDLKKPKYQWKHEGGEIVTNGGAATVYEEQIKTGRPVRPYPIVRGGEPTEWRE